MKLDQQKTESRFKLDTASYFAIWLVILMGGVFVVRLLDDNTPQTAVLPIPPTNTSASALSAVTATSRPNTAVPTMPIQAIDTNTPIPTPSNTPIPTPSNTPLPSPTNRPFVTLTATPSALPTPHEVYSWTLRVPILMYHYISVPPEDADAYRIDLSVEPDNFRAQMAYLAENGYTTIDLYTLSLAIADKLELPEKPVIITLDDGYRDNYDNAFPILQEYGLTATFFVVSEFIDRGFEAYVTWPMVEEMAAAGMRIEPHTKTHPDLSGQDRDYLIWQILGSQETVAAHIGYTPRYLAYPAGRYDENTITVLSELNFWGAVTTQGGKWHSFEDRYEWTRLRIRNNTHLAEFVDLVDLAGTVGGRPTNE